MEPMGPAVVELLLLLSVLRARGVNTRTVPVDTAVEPERKLEACGEALPAGAGCRGIQTPGWSPVCGALAPPHVDNRSWKREAAKLIRVAMLTPLLTPALWPLRRGHTV
jgi:hypothetical protein